MDATVKRKARSPKVARGKRCGRSSRRTNPTARIWNCASGCGCFLRHPDREGAERKLRKEFNTTLARFDLLAQLTRKPEGATMSEVSEL
jgi:hypothetical protein